MAKVKGTGRILDDLLSVNGRIIVTELTTNDGNINILIGAPLIYRKTHSVNANVRSIEADIKNELKSIINSAKAKLRDDAVSGRQFEVEVD